ncbi:cytochrome C biogenesis protein [Skermanella stibiiresistens SB22]|uniref:Cytochrome C biogenesis protein n=1 Tax=Skermanella stibiiresistens SB22 TaxID=1385369 RepID=W9HER4_9PROT|nr:c-type cytochrome biogenesis protein CcmI [Skermanella stibiiresistens]EWY42398.1 cytochrome C biogenesis protein [Skermanella stibiiresistens SB22]
MLFWIVAAAMTAAVTALVLTPLLRGRRGSTGRAAYDMEVYRDQLKELERDLARGGIDERQAQAARAEIGRRMLAVADEDTREAAPSPGGPSISRNSRWAALALCVVIPFGALAVYVPTGHPNMPGQPFASREAAPPGGATPEIMQAIAKLRQHLKDDPNDLQGWLLMGQTQTRMGDFDASAEAFRQAVAVSQGKDPSILSSYAEAMTAAAQGVVPEEASRTFEAVLQADPHDARAHYYLALARAQAGDIRGALDRWVALVKQSPADAPWLPTVRQRITDTAGQLGVDVASVMPQPLPPSQPQGQSQPGAPPNAPGPTRDQVAGAANMTPEQRDTMIRGMVDTLATRLRDNPNDADGWLRLGRAYRVLGETDKATEALRSGVQAAPGRVDLMTAYADALIASGGSDEAPPAPAVTVFRDVLKLQPDNPQALYYVGLDAARTDNTAEASQLWGKLLTQLQPGSPEHAEVQARLDGLKRGG